MKTKGLFLVTFTVLILILTTNVFAEDFIAKDSEVIYDESIAGNIDNIYEHSSISPLYEPCVGTHRHLSKRIYTGLIKTSYPPLYEVICYWCRGVEWIY